MITFLRKCVNNCPAGFFSYDIINPMSIFGGSKKNNIVVVLDISSGSIGCCTVETVFSGKPTILFSIRKPVNFLFDVSFEAFWRCAADALEKVLKLAKDNLVNRHPDEVLCVFSSPWYVSRISAITISKEKPFEIDEKFLNGIVNEQEQKIIEAHSAAKGRVKKTSAKIKEIFIEHEIMQAELNGYAVKNPLGKKTKTLKVRVYLSLGTEKVMEEIKDKISKHFGHLKIRFRTFPLLAMKILDGILKTDQSYMVVESREEMTDMIIPNNYFLDKIISFPKGINSLFKSIAAGTNEFFKEAPSMLNSYSRGHRALGDSGKIVSALEKGKIDWGTSFRKAISEMAEDGPAPQHLFFLGDELAEKYLANYAGRAEFSKFTALGRPFSVKKIASGWLKHYFSTEPAEVGSYKDIFLMVESLYAAEFL